MNKRTFMLLGAVLSGAFWSFVLYMDVAFFIGMSAVNIRTMNPMMAGFIVIGCVFGYLFFVANTTKKKRSKKAKAA